MRRISAMSSSPRFRRYSRFVLVLRQTPPRAADRLIAAFEQDNACSTLAKLGLDLRSLLGQRPSGENMKNQKLSAAAVSLAVALLLSVNATGTNLGEGFGIVCSQEWDFVDYDRDGLTNCAEMALGSLYNSSDTDGDGLPDGADLAPSSSLADVTVGVEISVLEEAGTRCDRLDSPFWDPYFEALFVELPTWESNGGRKEHLSKIGFTYGNHHHDARSHSPESIAASIALPTDVGMYQVDNVLDLPFIDLRLGLYDHDGGWAAEAVDFGAGRGLPISLAPDGSTMTIQFEGAAECRTLIDITINTPITFEDAYLSPIAHALSGSGENGAAALRDLPAGAQDRFMADGYLQNWIGYSGVGGHASSILSLARGDWVGTALKHPPGRDALDHSVMVHAPRDPDCHLVSTWSLEGYRPPVAAQMTMRILDGNGQTLNATSVSVSSNFTTSSMIGMPAMDVCGIGHSVQIEFVDIDGTMLYAKRWAFEAPLPPIPSGQMEFVEIDGDWVHQTW